ncbi:hypothetical protein HMPREF0290_0350 [Corynebacterium efficiens YS-314]|nr:hypothetical protein HMPREF0290_0350 [Corynebacterium efficiens YS-314]
MVHARRHMQHRSGFGDDSVFLGYRTVLQGATWQPIRLFLRGICFRGG